MSDMNILEMKGISKSFFDVKVLNNVQLQVKSGEVHVLLGENGAGKSTLIKILSGAYRKETGEIFLEEKPLMVNTPRETLDAGISIIYQELNLIPYLSIYENIYLGKEVHRKGIIDKPSMIEASKKILKMVGLDINPKTLMNNLSIAQKQMVEIAKALSNKVKVLVLDEPTATLTDTETKQLFNIIYDLKKQGIGIIYISHRMSELFEIGDRCTVLRDGECVDTVELRETNEEELTKMMVGRKISFKKENNDYIQKDIIVLEAKHIHYKDMIKDVSIDLKKGEILGIAGLVGAGRTELAKCIIGAYTKTGGEVLLYGRQLKGSVANSIKKGLVYLSEDRKDEGLVLIHSVRDNIALPNLKKFGKLFLNKKEINNCCNECIETLKIKTASNCCEAKNLSGGNQQKVVIGKWIKSDASVYIFDEPTRGIDVGAREEIYKIMRELLSKGASIIMISSDLVEVLKMCDRVVVMKEGQVSSVLNNDGNLTQETVLSYEL